MTGSFRAMVLCMAIVAGSGCAGSRPAGPPPFDVESVRIETVAGEARRTVGGVTGGRGEGAALGAAGGTLLWLEACGQAGNSDPAGLAPALCLLFTPVAAFGGGLYGLAAADGAEVVAPRVEIAEAVFAAFREEALGEAIGDRIAAVGGPRVAVGRTPAAEEALRLEIDDVHLSTRGASLDSTITLRLSARVRARTRDGAVVREERFRTASAARPLETWVSGEPPLLAVTADVLVEALAGEIVGAWFRRGIATPEALGSAQLHSGGARRAARAAAAQRPAPARPDALRGVSTGSPSM